MEVRPVDPDTSVIEKMEAYISKNGHRERELTWVSNSCFDSVTVLEEELDQP